MYDSSEYHETVEYLMRGAPDVVFLGLSRLWKVSLVMLSDVSHRGVQSKDTYNVKEYSCQHCNAFKIVVAKTGLLIKLGIRKDGSGMYDGCKSRETSSNKVTDS